MKATATNVINSNKRLIALFVLLVLSGAKMFGQQVEAATPAFNQTAIVAVDATESQIELVSWFMGTKQSQVSDSINMSNTISTNKTGKKVFINNGLSTNRILSRTFLKKATSSQSTIA